MQFRSSRIFLITGLILIGLLPCFGQSADKGGIYPKPGETDKEDQPKSFHERLEKMRIEKDKKDHEQMIERGEEVLKITEDLEKDFDANGRLTDKEKPKLAEVEKLVKKIRNELGGADDNGDDETVEPAKTKSSNLSPIDAIKSLRSTTLRLCDELKKTTRFSISAAAIQSSNTVLKITRFLRVSN